MLCIPISHLSLHKPLVNFPKSGKAEKHLTGYLEAPDTAVLQAQLLAVLLQYRSSGHGTFWRQEALRGGGVCPPTRSLRGAQKPPQLRPVLLRLPGAGRVTLERLLGSDSRPAPAVEPLPSHSKCWQSLRKLPGDQRNNNLLETPLGIPV